MTGHFEQRRSAAFLSLLLLWLGSAPAFAQFTSSVTEINPDSSTLDATDADGASGGRVNGLARASNGTTFYAASEWGGLWMSTDTGRTWAHLYNHLPMATWDVEVDPNDANKVYATSLYDGRVASLAGISVSSDGGATWTRPASATPPVGFCTVEARRTEPSAFGISIDPANTQSVSIGTNCGLARSTDGGATWTFIDPTPADGADNVWDVVVHDGGTIDLCGDDGHQRSTDGGANWTTAAVATLPGGRCSIAASPDESYVLFAVVGTTIYESDDGGASWPTTLTNPRAQGRIPFVATNQRTGATFDLWFGDVQLHRASCTTPAPAAAGGAARCPTNTWTGPFTRSAGGHDDTGDLAFDPTVAVNACPVLLSSDGGVYYNTVTTSPGCHSPAWEQPDTTPHALWLFAMDGATQAGTTTEDLYFGNQDNGTFAAADAGAAAPTWNNPRCCDSFDVSASPTNVVYTRCCFSPGRSNRLFLRNQGMVGGGEVNTYPAGNLQGFRPVDILDRWGPDDYALVTTGGVFITTNITTNPIVWTQLGAATSPANARGVKAAVTGGTPTFYVQAGNADGRSQDQLWSFTGTAAGGAWTQIQPPGNVGGFGIFDVHPNNPLRLIASHLQPGANPQMILSTDGGANWTNLAPLDTLMTGGGQFQYQNQRGPTNFTAFSGYPEPTLVAFDPADSDIIVAGAADAGVFVSIDGGTAWTLVTDPFDPVDSGRPHIPRPWFAYFDHEPFSLLSETVNIYLGTQGRGVWRIMLGIPRNIIVICEFFRRGCWPPELDKRIIILECLFEPCIFRDPIPKNCLVKFPCPGCEFGLCPPFYHLFLEDFDPRVWEVGLYTAKGDPAPFELFRTQTGVVLSFRPSKELFREGQIGDYELAFALRRGAKLGRYEIRTRLEVSDKPYRLGREPLLKVRPTPGAGAQ